MYIPVSGETEFYRYITFIFFAKISIFGLGIDGVWFLKLLNFSKLEIFIFIEKNFHKYLIYSEFSSEQS